MLTTRCENSHWRRGISLVLAGAGQDEADWEDLSEVEWDAFLRTARRNVILLRCEEGLERFGIRSDQGFREGAKAERERIRRTLPFIGRIGEICERKGIPHLFIKAFQHYPDMGHDIDLFVIDRSSRVDSCIGEELELLPGKGSIASRFAGKTSYAIRRCLSPLEIHHGVLGQLGEHNLYPRLLFERRQVLEVEGIRTLVPSPEDRLIIQAMQRIYGHFNLRVSDIRAAVTLLSDRLDWDYIKAISKRIGIRCGLACYLSYVEAISRLVDGDFEIDPIVRRELGSYPLDRLAVRRDTCRIPVVSLVLPLFGKKALADLKGCNWEGMIRIMMLPAVFALSLTESLTRSAVREARSWLIKP